MTIAAAKMIVRMNTKTKIAGFAFALVSTCALPGNEHNIAITENRISLRFVL